MNPGAVVALVIAATLWGTTGTAASFFPDNVSPIAVGAATMGIGGVLLFVFAHRRAVAVLRHRVQHRWVALGALGVVVYPLAFYSGMDLAGVAVGNVVALGSGPVFAALLEWMLERRPLSRRWGIATVFALLGIAALATSRAIFGDGASEEGRPGDAPVLGIAVALLAGLAYALYTYASGRAMATGGTSRGVMAAMFGLGGALLLPVLLVTGAPLLQSPATVGIAGYLVLGPMVRTKVDNRVSNRVWASDAEGGGGSTIGISVWPQRRDVGAQRPEGLLHVGGPGCGGDGGREGPPG